jgi:hypothetical protein
MASSLMDNNQAMAMVHNQPMVTKIHLRHHPNPSPKAIMMNVSLHVVLRVLLRSAAAAFLKLCECWE